MLATKHVTLTDTSLQEIVAVPNGFLLNVCYIFVANHGGSTNSVDLYIEQDATPQIYIFDGTSVQAGNRETLSNGGGPLFVLHPGESVKAQATSAGNFEVVLTFDIIEAAPTLNGFNV